MAETRSDLKTFWRVSRRQGSYHVVDELCTTRTMWCVVFSRAQKYKRQSTLVLGEVCETYGGFRWEVSIHRLGDAYLPPQHVETALIVEGVTGTAKTRRAGKRAVEKALKFLITQTEEES